MKKVFGLLLASTLVLGACGNSGNHNKESQTESVNENKTQFKNDTLVIDDAVLKIKDTFLVNDKNSDDKLLAFKYEVENKTDKDEITAFNVWLETMKAEQDNDNTVNELEVGLTPNTGKFEEWFKHSDDKIKKGKTAKGIVTYSLQNDEDVTLKANKGVDGKELGTKNIKLDDLKTVDYDAAADLTNESSNTENSEDDNTQANSKNKEDNSISEQTAIASAKTSGDSEQSSNQSTKVNATNNNASEQESKSTNNPSNDSQQATNNEIPTTTHDESQMGYGKGDYEAAREQSKQVWDDPDAHVGGPSWVGKNEGYDSWAKRQQTVQEGQQQ
ncbi:DUF5067 domain-containing protein [Staphylococcus saprophyticus]|nr:DUF5067 domain-containing protein [Staphylococcus saprophyticus]MDW4128429.1 DUF5067 domain-containing protein [Staphylococcus saprophyticus]MDW4184761.1 DUF5067 domain-containing protein [Staphylococcus saprophyticus]